MTTQRVHEIERTGRRVLCVVGDQAAPWVTPPASYAAVDLDEVVGTTADGEPIHVARDGYSHTRVVIRD